MTTQHGLPINEVNSIVGDGLGYFWIGHDHGIYRVLRAELLAVVEGRGTQVHCISYDDGDGLLSVENNDQISQPPSARDLHDGLGANLTELTLLSNVGETQAFPQEEMARRLGRLSESTHQALHSLRDLIWTTNPKADSLEALVSRLCNHAESRLRAAGLRCRVEVPDVLPAIQVPPEVRRELVMAGNEVVHNVIRHAGATMVWLRMPLQTDTLVVEIEDDGRGYDPSVAGQRASDGSRGLGLESVAGRMSSLGGVCQIQSTPGEGTCVVLRLPLPRG